MVTTRRQNYEREVDDNNPPHNATHPQQPRLPPLPPETLTEKRLRWSALLHAHQYHTVITQVLAEELAEYTRSTVIPTSLASIMCDCVLILASAPLIFTAAVDGVLAAQFGASEELQREYGEIQSRTKVQPSIYVHLLADENGVAPSANQYLQIRKVVLKYISADVRLSYRERDLGRVAGLRSISSMTRSNTC